MELVAARIDDDRVEVTLADGVGLLQLVGTPGEIAALCDAMDEVAVLAGASDGAAWLFEITVGGQVVRLGISRGRVRVVVGPRGG